jgi:hypothetical protein
VAVLVGQIIHKQKLAPLAPPKDPIKIFPQILHPGPQNRSQTIVRTPHRLMAVPEITINDVLGILNAVNKWAYSSRNIATVALKGLSPPDYKISLKKDIFIVHTCLILGDLPMCDCRFL